MTGVSSEPDLPTAWESGRAYRDREHFRYVLICVAERLRPEQGVWFERHPRLLMAIWV